MTERYNGSNGMGPDIDRDGEDTDPEFDYFGRVLDWEASHNDAPEDEEKEDEDSS